MILKKIKSIKIIKIKSVHLEYLINLHLFFKYNEAMSKMFEHNINNNIIFL